MPATARSLIAMPAPRATPLPTGAALERLATFAERLLDAPAAFISLVDGERPFSAPAGPDDAWQARRQAPLLRSICRCTLAAGGPLLMEDARTHPVTRENPLLWLGEAGYAGVVIRAGDGRVAGTLCVVDSRPRAWTDEDVDLLEALAGFAALTLDRRLTPAAVEAGFVGAIGQSRGRLSLRMLEKAVETMQVGVTITDMDGRILYSNPAEARMHGYEPQELRGRHARIFAPPDLARTISAEDMEQVTSWSREAVNVRKDGSLFPVALRSDLVTDSRGRPAGLVTCCEDITQRKEMERQLLRNAFYDPITGLPNRGLFTHRLDTAVERAARGEAHFAVVVVGLDRFKLVNDSLGHAAGDQLLAAVAGRLRGCVEADAMLAHVSGDQFAVLIEELGGMPEATRVAACVRDSLSLPFTIAGTELFTSAGVGIAVSYSGYERAEDVLRDASNAMYRSKDGDGQYEVFDPDMHAAAMARLRLEMDLRRALDRGELRVHYQPIISLHTGRICGFEALARWQHPERGLVLPDDFIPLAEETGLILPIGVWVLEEACRALRAWQDRGAPLGGHLTMAVNLSPRQFQHPDLVDRVRQVLADTGIAPGTLKLEITESALLQHTDVVTSTLHRLKALGVQLHIDDFGTGYSSLGYLHRLPLDALKIDRSFIAPTAGAEGLQLVRTIVALAQALGVAVVSEGIESPEVLSELRTLRCEYGQGYFFSRPLAPDAVLDLFAAEPSW